MVELERGYVGLKEEVRALRGIWVDLEIKIQAERERSHSVALVTWEAMEALEGVVANLGALPPLRWHTLGEIYITLRSLRRTEEVCLPVARAYRDHCVKVAWTTAFASLDKAGCRHMDIIATHSVAVATAKEVATEHRRTRKVSNVFV